MFRAGVTALSLLLVLVLFEFYLRSEITHVVRAELESSGGIVEADPEFLVQQTSRGRRFVPNARVVIKNHYLSQRDVAININSLGFRGDEVAEKKAPEEWRLLFLGDSVTVADYLPETELYPTLTGDRLSAKYQRTKIVSINTAIGNIGIEEEINILEDSLERIQPDVIVLGFFLNDSRPPWGFSGEIGDRGWLRRHSLIAETIYTRLEESKWIEKQGAERFSWIAAAEKLEWRSSPEAFRKLTSLAQIDWGAAWEPSSWQVVEQHLQRLERLAHKAEAPVLVVAFPVIYQVEAEFIEDSPQRELAQLAQAHGFAYLDLLPTLRAHRTEQLFLDHCHPSARGNEIIADAIVSSLVQAGFVPQTIETDRSEAS